MAQTLLEMAKDLTRTLVETGRLAAEDMSQTLQSTYTTLATLKAQEEAETSPSMRRGRTAARELAKEHHEACRHLPGMRRHLQAVIHPSSGHTRA